MGWFKKRLLDRRRTRRWPIERIPWSGYLFRDKVMSAAHALPVRTQSVGEEIANAVSHGVGLLLAFNLHPFVSGVPF